MPRPDSLNLDFRLRAASDASAPVGVLPFLPPSRPLALLLGAGGIRGCAHVGVLSVLEEMSLSADIVVGSSIGSLYGAAYAAGWEIHRIRRLTDLAPVKTVAEFYANRLRIDERTYLGRIMLELGRDTRIEELPRPFAAMALDCSTGRAVPLTSGPVLQAVEASIALPGIARPVEIGATSYLDGGMRGPIPSAVAHAMGANSIIRVDLVGNHPLKLASRTVSKSRLTNLVLNRMGIAPIPVTPPAPAAETSVPELIISPRFYGLFCNAPLGIGFCARRGRSAALRALGDDMNATMSPTALENAR